MLYDVPYGMTLLGFSFPCCNDKVNFQLYLPSSGKTTQQTMSLRNCSLCCVVQCTVATFVYLIWNETKKKRESILCKCSWPSGMCSNAKQTVLVWECGKWKVGSDDGVENMRFGWGKEKYLTCNLNKNDETLKCVVNCAKMRKKNVNLLWIPQTYKQLICILDT